MSPLKSMAGKNYSENKLTEYAWIAAVFIFCITYATFWQWDAHHSPYIVNDDASQHLAWMHRWGDNQFHPGDPLNELGELIQPWGFWALNRVLALFLDPVAVSKFLPYFTLIAACIFCFLIVKKRFGPVIGMASVILLASAVFERMVGFNARATAFPLLLAFLFFWVEKKTGGAAIALILSALFYPIALLIEFVVIGCAMFVALAPKVKSRFRDFHFDQMKVGVILAAMIVSVAIAFAKSRQIAVSEVAGPSFSKKELLTMEEFGENGRVYIDWERKSMVEAIRVDYSSKPFVLAFLLLAACVLLAGVLSEKRFQRYGLTTLSLLFAAVFLHFAADVFLMKLFLPSRYLRYTLPVFFTLAFAWVLGMHREFWSRWVPATMLLTLMVSAVFFYSSKNNNGLVNYQAYAQLFQAVERLPGDGLIAGPPVVCDQVPLFSRRSVLMSMEAAHALYFKNYWGLLKPRMMDFIDSYTSDNLAEVEAFVKKYGIDYLIIDHRFFDGHASLNFFEPLDSYFAEKIEAMPRNESALRKLPAEYFIPVDEFYSLLDCRKLKNSPQN